MGGEREEWDGESHLQPRACQHHHRKALLLRARTYVRSRAPACHPPLVGQGSPTERERKKEKVCAPAT